MTALAACFEPDSVIFYPAERKIFTPPENLTVSQWAALHRVVIDGDYRGKWNPRLAPFADEPMDCFNMPWVQVVILDWPPQVAKSQIGFNWLMYAADQDPGPAMYAMPDMFSCGRISNKRLIPTFRATPRIAALLSPLVDDTSTFYINLLSMPIMMAWAGSPAAISSEPVRILICDEVEKYPVISGKETAPLDLLIGRTKGYPYTKKMLFASTCANEGGNMDKLIKEVADETRDFVVVCPICQHHQVMPFENITWPGGRDADPRMIERKRLAWYSCVSCGMKWDNLMRDAAVRHPAAHWSPRAPVTDGKPRAIHYHLPSWVVPSTPLSEVAAAFLRGEADPSAKKTFVTQHRAEPFVDLIARKAESELVANRVDLAPLVCPAGTVGVTMFVDPGKDVFWFGACAWQRDMSAHLVHYGYVTTWEEVRSLIHDTVYAVDGVDGLLLPVWRAGIDTGGGRTGDEDTTMTEEAYDFIRIHGAGRLVGTKGKDAAYWTSGRKIRASVIDRTPRKKPIPGGINLWVLNVGAFKDAVHYRLGLAEGSPGRLTFHADSAADLFGQIAAEEKKRDKYGRMIWVQTGKRNHYFDVLVGNFALADPEASGGIKVKPAPQPSRPPAPPGPPPPYIPDYAARHREKQGGGFVNKFRR